MSSRGKMVVILSNFSSFAVAQQAGEVTLEESPSMSLQTCSNSDGCRVENAGLVLDANWRWVHAVGGYNNCYVNGNWDPALCPDPETCQLNCAVEGVNAEGYKNTYGVHHEADGVRLDFTSTGGNVGSRLYITDGTKRTRCFA